MRTGAVSANKFERSGNPADTFDLIGSISNRMGVPWRIPKKSIYDFITHPSIITMVAQTLDTQLVMGVSAILLIA